MVPSEGFEPPTGGLEVLVPAFISVRFRLFGLSKDNNKLTTYNNVDGCGAYLYVGREYSAIDSRAGICIPK